MRLVHILNGPNLNLLGVREPLIYGTDNLEDVRRACDAAATRAALSIEFFQTNHEGVMVDLIQAARQKADAIIINPAGLSFHSVPVLDALKTFDGPILEVHISNIHRRDEHHRHSIISTAADGVICGLGVQGYVAAIGAIAAMPVRYPGNPHCVSESDNSRLTWETSGSLIPIGDCSTEPAAPKSSTASAVLTLLATVLLHLHGDPLLTALGSCAGLGSEIGSHEDGSKNVFARARSLSGHCRSHGSRIGSGSETRIGRS